MLQDLESVSEKLPGRESSRQTSDEENQANYPRSEDSSFTPDEIEIISEFKANHQKKINKNHSILKGLEVSFWGITSYSLARFLILTSGTQGLTLAIASTFLINQITNRDCLDNFRVNKKDDQWEIDGMGRLIKFGLSTIVSVIVFWGAIGDFIQMVNSSKQTYNTLQTTVDEFNKLPNDEQNKLIVIVGISFIAGVYTISCLNRR
jgi:ABC-type multidrug transport system fused ATPase/permease subunit